MSRDFGERAPAKNAGDARANAPITAERLRWIETWAKGWRLLLERRYAPDRDYYAHLPLDVAVAMIEELADDVHAYRRSLIAHHDIATLSEKAVQESLGGPCQICRRAQQEQTTARLVRGMNERANQKDVDVR